MGKIYRGNNLNIIKDNINNKVIKYAIYSRKKLKKSLNNLMRNTEQKQENKL